MRFWVLENTKHNYARIHLADCRYCRNGQGPRPGHTGNWTGFESYGAALVHAQSTNKRLATCTCCQAERVR